MGIRVGTGEDLESGEPKVRKYRQLFTGDKGIGFFGSLSRFMAQKRRDLSSVSSDSLSVVAERWKETLKHMRAFGFSRSQGTRVVDYRPFHSLKVLCLDANLLCFLGNKSDLHLPPSLSVIHLSHHKFDEAEPLDEDFGEELLLARLLRLWQIPNLKTVAAPNRGWDSYYKEAVLTRSKELRAERRKPLKGLAMFTSGRVVLQLLDPREIRE